MKRKLSLLMAAVMALSALPFTATEVHASSQNRFSGVPGSVVPNNAVFVELEASDALHARLPGNMGGGTHTAYAIRSGYFELALTGPVNVGDAFRLELSNAEWFFRAANNALVTPVFPAGHTYAGDPRDPERREVRQLSQGAAALNATTGPALGTAGTQSIRNFFVGEQMYDYTTGTYASGIGVISDEDLAFLEGESNRAEFASTAIGGLFTRPITDLHTNRAPLLTGTAGAGSDLGYHRIGTNGLVRTGDVGWGGVTEVRVQMTYDPRRGVFFPNTPGNQGSYVRFGRFAYVSTNNYVGNSGSTDFTTGFGVSVTPYNLNPRMETEVPYMLNVSAINPRIATVHMLETDVARTGADQRIVRIPLAIRLTDNAQDVTITVENAGHRAFVTPGTHLIVSAGGIATTAHVVNPVVARDRFEVERLVITELRANSIRRTAPGTHYPNVTSTANAFDLVLPPGFYFENNLPALVMWIEEGLSWGAGATGLEPGVASQQGAGRARHGSAPNFHGQNIFHNSPGTGDFNIFFPNGYENNRNRLRVRMNHFNESHVMPGRVSIEGLVIWAEENAPFDIDVYIDIQNTSWIGFWNHWQGGQANNVDGPLQAPQAPAIDWVWFPGIAANGTYSMIPAGWVPRSFFPEFADIATLTVGSGANYETQLNPGHGNSVQQWIRAWRGLHGPAATATAQQLPRAGGGTIALPTLTPEAATVGNWWGGIGTQGQAWAAQANGGNMVTAMAVRAASRRDWEVRLSTEGDIPELISGRYEGPTSAGHRDHQTARVVFEEIVPNSWWAGRQVVLSLPEEVRWRRVRFEEVRGSASNTVQEEHVYVNISPTNQGLQGTNVHASAGQGAQRGVRFNANRMYWTDVLANRVGDARNERAFIRFDAWVSIAAHFEGDIILTASGSAVPYQVYTNLPYTVIATAIPPVRVATSITDTRIGYQFQQTADIVITETRAGNLLRDRNVRLTVTDFVQVDTLFSPNVNIEVTGGNLVITNIGTGLAGSLYMYREGTPTLGVEANRGTLSFDIQGQSHGEPAQITVSNVSVRVDRTVPETNDRPYSVVVWGSAIANNFGHYDTRPVGQSVLNWPLHERTNNDRFMNYPGIVTDYVRVVTGGDGSSWLAQEVRVAIGETYYTVNGMPVEMDVAAFIDPTSDSTFVPLRFIANAFGLNDDRDIVWDDHNRTVTLILPTGRVVQFQVDSSIMLDNGAPRNVVNARGEAISPMIQDGRTFLPFRFLGEVVFGVEVAWEADTQTAIFNPSRNVVSE